ncbi:MAG TPA: intradiol ring-cleavage dioxygenase [Jiangellaceae bacterium]|nr:intradiol ring-cleavage dioxygenase [Jiangellaceae bacterium]
MALLDQGGTCGLSSEETEGPYYFDVDSIRSDIREDRPGTTLTLGLRVRDAECNPVPDSVVEIWHCDAGGEYSGFESASASGGRAGGRAGGGVRSDDGTYLRGAQVADAKGIVQFTTVYPGWYRGRTVHIHLKVHVDTQTVLTSQLFFDDDLNDAVFATSPYDEHTGRDTRNDDDSIYDDSGRLTTQENGDGYLAVINLGIDT